MVYDLLKRYLGPSPVYATVGNHDTYVRDQSHFVFQSGLFNAPFRQIQFQMIPYAMGGYLGSQFNWLVVPYLIGPLLG